MKHSLAIYLGVILTFTACDNDIITRNVKDLPEKASSTLNSHFSYTKVSYIKIDKEFLCSPTYEVQLVDGSEVKFDDKGIWKEIDCKHSIVPLQVIPIPIINQVKDVFPEQSVTKIEVKRKGYEIELTNGNEIRFDEEYNIKDID